MKKILAIVLVLAFMFTFAACGSQPAPAAQAADTKAAETKAPETKAAEKASDKAPIKVAGIVFQEDQFMKDLTRGYVDAAKAAGVECLTGNTSNDVGKENELINTYVAQKISGLAIAPLNNQASIAALQKADEAGMKIATTNIALTNAPFIVGGYTSDNKVLGQASGAVAAKFVKEKLGGKANVCIVQFKSQVPDQSAARVDGLTEELKKMPGVKVVADIDAWLPDMGLAKVTDVLTAHPDINVFVCANDGGTIGATAAIKAKGLAGKAFVFGFDATEQTIAAIKSSDNILQCVVGQDPYNMGKKAMELLIKNLKGEDTSAMKGKVEVVPGMLIDRNDPNSIPK